MQGIGSPNQPIITHLQTLALQTGGEEDDYILDMCDLQKLVRLQSLVRGCLQRRKYDIVRMQSRGSAQYFDYEEARETIVKKPFEERIEAIRTYKYETGGIYKGCWRGNLRHGQGFMEWPNGATYEGSWEYNQANGKGKFSEPGGSLYDGTWVNGKS